MEFIQIEVKRREDLGSSNARRLRRDGWVPANLYGLGRPNLNMALQIDDVERFLASDSHLIELRMADKTRPAIVREVQQDALTDDILHLDFNRVDADQKLEDDVRIEFKGRPKGEQEGGMLSVISEVIRVQCKPLDIPGPITIDISNLALGENISAGDVPLPENVELVSESDETLVTIALPKAAASEDEGEEGEGEDATPAV